MARAEAEGHHTEVYRLPHTTLLLAVSFLIISSFAFSPYPYYCHHDPSTAIDYRHIPPHNKLGSFSLPCPPPPVPFPTRLVRHLIYRPAAPQAGAKISHYDFNTVLYNDYDNVRTQVNILLDKRTWAYRPRHNDSPRHRGRAPAYSVQHGIVSLVLDIRKLARR